MLTLLLIISLYNVDWKTEINVGEWQRSYSDRRNVGIGIWQRTYPVDEIWQSGNGSASGSGSPTVSSTSSCSGNVQLHAEWIEKVFGQCVDTPLRYVAFVIGITSIAFWFFAQAP